jgi:membrane protease YdiL (CAAX protease family)
MNKSGSNLLKRYPLGAYFFLAFIFSWLILAPGVAANLGWIEFNMDGMVLTFLSALGPLLAALIVRSSEHGQKGIQKIFQSVFKWKVGWKWWAAAVLLVPILMGAAVIISRFVPIPGMEDGGNPTSAGGTLAVLILLLFLGSFGEEPGWRGFALPRLQEKYKPVTATLILTFFWWLWHIPTYWTLPVAINTRLQFGFLMAFGMQFAVLLALGLLCTWVFNGSKGSVLMAVLLHVSWNFWSLFVNQAAATFMLPLFLVSALIVGFTTRGKLGYSTTK